MPNTNRMGWTYPTEYQVPYYNLIETFYSNIDLSVYALREDNHLVLTNSTPAGVTLSDAPSIDTFAWTADFILLNMLTGGTITISAGSIILEDGKILAIDVSRPITGNSVKTFSVENTIGSDENKIWIAVRRGTLVYLRNGTQIVKS